MNGWMDDFIAKCLEEIPEGTYHDQAEAELRDHLLSLSRDLEGAGYSPEEARSKAQARMGDPAALAHRYAQAWKRRLRQRGLARSEILLFELCIVFAGWLYVINAYNFGKSIVAYWGLVAILTAMLMFFSSGSSVQFGTVTRICYLILTVIQLPPIKCWIVYSGGSGFEMSGVMVPGWAGLLAHLLLLVWGLANYWVISKESRFKQTA